MEIILKDMDRNEIILTFKATDWEELLERQVRQVLVQLKKTCIFQTTNIWRETCVQI